MPSRPNIGTYIYYWVAAVLFVVFAAFALTKGDVVLGIVFVLIAVYSFAFPLYRRRRRAE